jgi:hypothetical protein
MTIVPEFDKDGIAYMTSKYAKDYHKFKSDQTGFSSDLDIEMVDMLNAIAMADNKKVLEFK